MRKSFGEGKAGRGRGGRPWRRKRERVFRRDLFMCQACKRNGKTTGIDLHGPRAGRCDHIIPLEEGGTDDADNLETLCKRCHDRKTATDQARMGKKSPA